MQVMKLRKKRKSGNKIKRKTLNDVDTFKTVQGFNFFFCDLK